MKRLKDYFLNRANEINTWIGALGLPLEFLLHERPSMLMYFLFFTLMITPQATLVAMAADGQTKLKNL